MNGPSGLSASCLTVVFVQDIMKEDINTEQEMLYAVRQTNALKTVSINDLAKSFVRVGPNGVVGPSARVNAAGKVQGAV